MGVPQSRPVIPPALGHRHRRCGHDGGGGPGSGGGAGAAAGASGGPDQGGGGAGGEVGDAAGRGDLLPHGACRLPRGGGGGAAGRGFETCRVICVPDLSSGLAANRGEQPRLKHVQCNVKAGCSAGQTFAVDYTQTQQRNYFTFFWEDSWGGSP